MTEKTEKSKPESIPEKPPELSLEGQAMALRKRVGAQFIEVTKAKGSMLSPEVLENFLPWSYRSIYRWREAAGAFLPTLEQSKILLDFLQKVTDLRNCWHDVVKKWGSYGFGALETDIRLTMFNQKMLTVLEDPESSPMEKTELLTFLTLRALAKV